MKKLNIVIVLLVVTLAGCAVFGEKPKPYSEMSPQERAIFILSVYNNQYDLYLREVVAPDLTEDKKVMLRQKKKALTELHPYVRIYSNYADLGMFAPADVEIAVMKIIDRLLGL